MQRGMAFKLLFFLHVLFSISLMLQLKKNITFLFELAYM